MISQQEVFTDGAATVIRLTPIDDSAGIRYMLQGTASINGQPPVVWHRPILAESLHDAFSKVPETAEAAKADLQRQINDASMKPRIALPGAGINGARIKRNF